MGWNRGRLRQPFKIEVDIDKLVDYITDQILANINDDDEMISVDLDEWYTEDNTIVIDGSYDAYFRSIYTPATRYEPSDYEEESPSISDVDPQWMLHGLPDEIVKNVRISRVEEDREKCEHHYFGEDAW